jgi:AraC-like DNA-binding protein
MEFLTHPAPASLKNIVRELWHLEDDGKLHAGLPKPYVELVVSLGGVHWWRAAPAAAEHRYVDAWVTPIQSGPRYARSVGRRRLIGVRLEPWTARAMFGPLPRGDGQPPPRLTQLIGSEGRSLRSALLKARDLEERFYILSLWLERQPAMQRAGQLALDPRRACRAADLAREMRCSDRSLRRLFAQKAGIAPKQWLRLHRIDAVLRDGARCSSDETLAGLAQEHGYADQAHFTRDLTAMTGVTPRRLRNRSEQLPPHMFPIE